MILGPLMIDLLGTELSEEERDYLRHPLVGGVILFTRNFESCEQIETLVNAIHSARGNPLLVAVDHEGGRVQRFRDGFTRLPDVARLGAIYDTNKKRARELAKTTGWLMAVELRSLGIDISFAPVLDINHGLSDIIGNRAFHVNPEIIADLAHAYMHGMHDAGMSAVGKHFPGHGGIKEDTHLEFACDERDFTDLQLCDLLPFERMIHFDLPAIMAAHVVYPKIDQQPAGFSAIWLRKILRQQLGFQGVIFSDDLSMTGALHAGDILDRTALALEAGCDMALICNDQPAMVKVLDHFQHEADPASAIRLARMHGKHAITREQMHQEARWHKAVKDVEAYSEHDTLDLNI